MLLIWRYQASGFSLLLCFCSVILTGCSGLFFVPDKQLILHPDRIGLVYKELTVDTEDGGQLHGWLLPGKTPVKGSVVFLHGNAQNISYHIASIYWLPRYNYNVYLYDYRGFGRSKGKATIENSIEDFAAVMERLQQVLPPEEQRFIVFGQSLGAAVAIAAVSRYKKQYPVECVVLDSSFSGFRRIAQEKLELLPVIRYLSGILAYTFTDSPNLLLSISRVSPVPVLLIHGMDDEIVPPHHSQKLFEAAKPPKKLWLEPGAKHIQSLSNASLREQFIQYLRACVTEGPPATLAAD